MIYELAFDPRALKEWQKLGATVREQFKKKLKSSGFRLVYQVQEAQVTVLVIAIGKREKSAVYQDADKRLED
jgi:Cytotoxic translational repressor of toxin-antitoxin stability system